MASLVTVTVRVRDATREGLRSVRNSINSVNRGILHSFADTFSDGIGQALARGFRSAATNPYVAAALVALMAVIALQLGTALAGALTLAFGGAFIAMGVMAAKNSKKVKDAFSREIKSLKKEFADAAKPLEPVLVNAAKLMGKIGREFAPMFKQAMATAAPVLDDFMERMAKGLRTGGFLGFQKMMKAFNTLLANMDIGKFFDDLGKSFDHLGSAVLDNRKAVAGIMDSLLGLLPMVINLVADMVEAWGRVQPFFSEIWKTVKILLTPAMKALGVAFAIIGDVMHALAGPMSLVNRIMKTFYEEAIKPTADFIGRVFGPIWNGLIEGFTEGWKMLETGLVPVLKDLWEIIKNTAMDIVNVLAPGFFDLDDKAGKAGRTLKEWIIDKMTDLSDWLSEHREDIKEWAQKIADGAVDAAHWIKEDLIPALVTAFNWVRKNWRLILTVTGISLLIDIIKFLMTAWGWVNRNWHLILRFTGIGSIIEIIRLLGRAWGWLNRNWKQVLRFSFPGATSIINRLATMWNFVSRAWSRSINFNFTVSGALGTIRKMMGFAHGGVVGHIGTAATGGVRGNMTLVGESGPELVNLAPGSHVKSNPDTRRILAGGGPGSGQPMVINLVVSGRVLASATFDDFRKEIRNRGGLSSLGK